MNNAPTPVGNTQPIPSPDAVAVNFENFLALGPEWVAQTRTNLPMIERDFRERPASILDVRLPEVRRPDLVALVSPGPSLDESVEDLRDFPGVILAGVTSLGPLLARGIRPHGVCAVDSGATLAAKLAMIPRQAYQDMDWFVTPFSHPALLAMLPAARRWWFHAYVDGTTTQTCPACGKILISEFNPPLDKFNLVMSWLVPEVAVFVLQGGSVGNTLPELVSRWGEDGNPASRLGPDGARAWVRVPAKLAPLTRVLLYGFDFSYPGARGRSTTWTWDAGGAPHPAPEAPIHSQVGLVKARSAGGESWVLTDGSQLAYKRSLLAWWFMTWTRGDLRPQYLINVGAERGILGVIPQAASWEEAAEIKLGQTYTKSAVEAAYIKYCEVARFEPGVNSGLEGYPLEDAETDISTWREAR